MTLNDAIMKALDDRGYEGSFNDRLFALYRENLPLVGTFNDAELAFLKSLGATGTTLNDAWVSYLRSLGFTGTLNDMKLRFWEAGGFGIVLGILSVGSSGTLRGYREGAFGEMDPNTIEGATVFEFSADSSGACVLALGDGTEQLPSVDRIDVDIEGFGTLAYIWNETNTQYEATSVPLFTYLDGIVGFAIDLFYTVYAINRLPNSILDGMSGSVSGGDFVFPTGWTGGFWPPEDAVALPDDRIRFVVSNERGYLVYTIDTADIVGEIVNASVYVDEVIEGTGQRAIHLTNGATEVGRGNNRTDRVGRVYGLYEITATEVQVRVGAGTTAPSNQNYVCSRPQITLGERLRPYRPTYPNLDVLFQDTFTDVAGTLLSAHTPEVGAGWLVQGSELGITAENTAQARGTGTGTGNPNYHGNLMDVPAPVGRKLFVWRSSRLGGTSLSQGVFLRSNAAGDNKIICGLINDNMAIQSWQASSFDNLVTFPIPDAGQGDAPYPQPFFAILDGDLITMGYGDWFDPIVSETVDVSALTGFGDGMGLIMRASGPTGIYDFEYADFVAAD